MPNRRTVREGKVIAMSWGSIPRIHIFVVNWIVRRIGVGVTLVAVLAIVAGFCAARHGNPLASGMIWVK